MISFAMRYIVLQSEWKVTGLVARILSRLRSALQIRTHILSHIGIDAGLGGSPAF